MENIFITSVVKNGSIQRQWLSDSFINAVNIGAAVAESDVPHFLITIGGKEVFRKELADNCSCDLNAGDWSVQITQPETDRI